MSELTAPKISADKLCSLTGLTDRRHRQLSKEGYFPPPLRGEYLFVPTLQGLFKYFQEQVHKRDDTEKSERKLLIKAKRETAQEELAILREQYVEKTLLGPALRNISLHQRAVLQRKLETELAPKLAGLKPIEILNRMAAAVDEICAVFNQGIRHWMESDPGGTGGTGVSPVEAGFQPDSVSKQSQAQ